MHGNSKRKFFRKRGEKMLFENEKEENVFQMFAIILKCIQDMTGGIYEIRRPERN